MLSNHNNAVSWKRKKKKKEQKMVSSCAYSRFNTVSNSPGEAEPLDFSVRAAPEHSSSFFFVFFPPMVHVQIATRKQQGMITVIIFRTVSTTLSICCPSHPASPVLLYVQRFEVFWGVCSRKGLRDDAETSHECF